MTSPQRIHGGPDALGVPRFDFSTNSNACGPCPVALAAVQQADARHYPDASYAALRAQLAAFHGVEVQRVLLAGSASEFIFRITAWVAQQGGRQVCLPPHSYGDYAQAAQAWGLAPTNQPDDAQLMWACEPSSPLGATQARLGDLVDELGATATVVLDRAYEPLRLNGALALTDAQFQTIWQLWTPNKALGLTGVRAGYAIAPLGAEKAVAALEQLCPSWPVGAHGVALLQSWVQPEVQAWLTESLQTLRAWKARQIALLQALGWTCLPSGTNFFCARPGQALDLNRLRTAGIKLRDTTSFGLPGHFRLSVQPPVAQDALKIALQTGPSPVFTNFEGEVTMTALTIRLPNSVHESIKLLARKDGISVNQFIASAAAEKMASFQTLDYLRREAALGKREDFEQFLKLVPDVPAQAGDALSSDIDTLVKTRNKKP